MPQLAPNLIMYYFLFIIGLILMHTVLSMSYEKKPLKS